MTKTETNIVEMGHGQPDYPEQIDAAMAKPTGDAQPTSRDLESSSDSGYAEEWAEPCVLPDGRTGHRIYLFDAAEVERAGDDPSNLPWDDAHVARIRLDG